MTQKSSNIYIWKWQFLHLNVKEDGSAYTRWHTQIHELDKSRYRRKRKIGIWARPCVHQEAPWHRCVLNLGKQKGGHENRLGTEHKSRSARNIDRHTGRSLSIHTRHWIIETGEREEGAWGRQKLSLVKRQGWGLSLGRQNPSVGMFNTTLGGICGTHGKIDYYGRVFKSLFAKSFFLSSKSLFVWE